MYAKLPQQDIKGLQNTLRPPEAPTKSQLFTAISHMGERLEQLDKLVTSLSAQLEPVLRQEPEVVDQAAKSRPDCTSSLADQIWNLVEAVMYQNRRLESCLHRLDL